MLSICIYALSPEARRETTIGFWDAALLAHYADHIRPMTYDLYCPPSQFIGPTSTAPWGRDCMSYMVTHVPRHKIIMGLPTYSVDWNINDPKQSRQVYDHEWIAAREKESPIGRGWCYYWDVNLIRFNDANNHAHLLYVSDARSTKSHLVTVDSMDLGGICFWMLSGGDDPAIWQCVGEHLKRW
jgi:spore germination protein YaaH